LLSAATLGRYGVEIEGLILFDPVAKYVGPGVQTMPKNVKNSITFVRHLNPKIIKKYARTADEGLNPKVFGEWANNPMRPGWGVYFENLLSQCSNEHSYHGVVGSHGALGGVGWKHVSEDYLAQSYVADTANKWFAKLGYSVGLKSTPPENAAISPKPKKASELYKREQFIA